MSVVLVDWLGRGGISHTTESWALALRDEGIDTSVVTRPHRELGEGRVKADVATHYRNRALAHRAVAVHAASRIEDLRPTTVVVQNYVIPQLEFPVYRAARRAGAQVVLVVHDHRLHSRWAGLSFGLGDLLRRADVLVVHSGFVGREVSGRTGRDIVQLPLPAPVGIEQDVTAKMPFARPGGLLAIQFGTLHRGYKGGELFMDIAKESVPGWSFAAVGVGARSGPGVIAVDRFVRRSELVAAVAGSDVTLLPYGWATQSASAALAHAVGSVPVSTAVGGLPEQITNGIDGLILGSCAGVGAWCEALEMLSDTGYRATLRAGGRRRSEDNQRAFLDGVRGLAGA